MAERLQVVRRTLTYPADADSLSLVRAAGGFSKLAPETRARVRFKAAAPGDFCDDLPAESIAHRLASGDIVRVSVDDAPLRKVKA